MLGENMKTLHEIVKDKIGMNSKIKKFTLLSMVINNQVNYETPNFGTQ